MAIELSELLMMEKLVKDAEEKDQHDNLKKMEEELFLDPSDRSPLELTFRYTECRQPCPSFFQVERSPDDLQFVEELNETEAKWSKKHRYPMENLIKDEAARTISIHFNDLPDLKKIREEAIATNNYDFYHKGIRAAAILIHDLYPKDHFIHSSYYPLLHNQLTLLWEQFAELGKEGWSFAALLKYIIRSKIDRRNFSFVTETNIVPVLHRYHTALSYKPMFERPYVVSFGPSHPKNNATYLEIRNVTRKMKFRPRWKHDEYATFLVDLMRSDNLAVEGEKILADIRKECDLKPLPTLFEEDEGSEDEGSSDEEPSFDEEKELQIFLRFLFMKLRVMIRSQLRDVLRPITFLTRSTKMCISSAVRELIQVAELHRMALGSRFLRKNDFLWAFYKCGYGLPPRVMVGVEFETVSENHPPYHIYTAAVELAKSLDKKKVRLEHLVFAVLYAKDSHVIAEQVMEMLVVFKHFMEVVIVDFMERYTDSAGLWITSSFQNFVEESMAPYLGMVVSETSSAIS